MVIPQMVYGKPRLKLELNIEVDGLSMLLVCELKNEIIDNSLLRRMGIYRRTIESLSVTYSVEEMEKSEMIVEDVTGQIISIHDSPKMSGSLPPSASPTSWVVIVEAGRSEGGYAHTVAHYDPKNITLQPGRYHLTVQAKTSDKEVSVSRIFVVAQPPETIKWEVELLMDDIKSKK